MCSQEEQGPWLGLWGDGWQCLIITSESLIWGRRGGGGGEMKRDV